MPRLTDEDRELIIADHHTGHYTVRELSVKHKVGKTTIAKIVKDIEPKHRDKVDALIAVKTELAGESGQEVDSIHTIVDKKTKHIEMINNNAELLSKKLLGMVDMIDTPNDLKTLAEANDKLAITLKVADRHAPKIDVTQLQQQTSGATTVNIVEDKVGD